MAPIEYYRNLKQQKKALLVESDLNRLVLRLELEKIRSTASRVDSTLTAARKVGPWLLPLVSAVGFFAGRRARKVSASFSWIKMAIQYLPILLQFAGIKKAPK